MSLFVFCSTLSYLITSNFMSRPCQRSAFSISLLPFSKTSIKKSSLERITSLPSSILALVISPHATCSATFLCSFKYKTTFPQTFCAESFVMSFSIFSFFLPHSPALQKGMSSPTKVLQKVHILFRFLHLKRLACILSNLFLQTFLLAVCIIQKFRR